MTANTGTAIVQAAHEDANLCAVGQTVSAAQAARGLSRLNDIINLEATQGLKLWLQEIITVQPVVSQVAYRIGAGGALGNTVRPLQVIQGTFVSSAGGRQDLGKPLSRDEYTRLSQLTGNDSAITSFFPDRKATYTDVFLWNTPDTQAATGTVELICRTEPAQMAVISATTIFPLEWAIFLRWALADEICTGQSQPTQDRCAMRASQYREALQSFDVEDAATSFQPNMRAYPSNGFR